jgi:uncharacterized protein (DUF885 family)
MSRCIGWAVSVICVTCVAVVRAEPPQAAKVLQANESTGSMRAIVERYDEDQRALNRYFGQAESGARRERMARFLREQGAALDAVDFSSLDRPGKVDYLLLRNTLAFETKQLGHERRQAEEVEPLVPFAKAIVDLEDARRRGKSIDPEGAAKAMTEIASQTAAARKGLEERLSSKSKDVPSKVLADRAARDTDTLRNVFRRWHDFYDGYDPLFSWWAKQTYPKAEKELGDYAEFLRKRLGGGVAKEGEEEAVIGDPIGRDALLDALGAEMIPYTPEELIEIANKEFAWCEKEMQRAVRDLGVETWQQALDLVSRQHVKPGEQPALIKKLGEEATKFVEDRQLVTVPELCKETWRMEMMTPERQKVNPYFTGGEVISVSYPTDTMSFEDKLMGMRGNNPSFCRATVHHELIPGHHLQIFQSQRFNPHRRVFRTPFLVEGWALYWEMRLWDLDFPRNAEDRVGMLFWRAHRCARIIFSLNFHLGKMTAPEAIEFLVKRVGHEPKNATAEVRRSVNGSYGPLYQAAYMLGGLQLRELQKELVGGGKMSERQFHDAVLREGAIPVEMIRASLSGGEVVKEFKTVWRFYPGMN